MKKIVLGVVMAFAVGVLGARAHAEGDATKKDEGGAAPVKSDKKDAKKSKKSGASPTTPPPK